MNNSVGMIFKEPIGLQYPQVQKNAKDLHPNVLLDAKKAIKVEIKGSSFASNHPSHYPLLSQEIKENMVESVVECIEESKNDNKLDIEEVIFPFVVVPDTTQEMTKILENLQVQASPKKINKKKKRKLNCQKRAAEKEQKEKQAREKLNQQPQQKTLTQANQQTNFKLKPLLHWKYKEQIEDRNKIGVDFRFSPIEQVAKLHMWKRLNFFLVTCRYIANRAEHLKGCNFPTHSKNQFKAMAAVVPASSNKLTDHDSKFERAHISLINKIVVNKNNCLFTMEDKLDITARKIETNLHHFFNICDIAPVIINSIDWYAEYYLRQFAYELLEAVKSGEERFEEVAHTFARSYGLRLIELQERILYTQTKADKDCFCKKEFEAEMAKMMADREKTLKYIDDMLIAIIHFREQFLYLRSPGTVVDKPEYHLYEEIPASCVPRIRENS